MAKDRFKIALKCPTCEKSGLASCWQMDGFAFSNGDTATRVAEVPEGFSRVKKPSSYGDDINFICDDCGEISIGS